MNKIKEIQLTINNLSYDIKVADNMPLLWVLRDELGLVGTKYGCGMGLCGACSVLIDGVSVRSCLISVGSVNGEITTIEGLGNPDSPHLLQEAWIEHQVAQCGYCQSGQIITACAMLKQNSTPNESEVKNLMSGNLCRCGTYFRIQKAIRSVADKSTNGSQNEEVEL